MTDPKTLAQLKAEMEAAYADYLDAFCDSSYAHVVYEAALVAYEAKRAYLKARDALEAQENSDDWT